MDLLGREWQSLLLDFDSAETTHNKNDFFYLATKRFYHFDFGDDNV